MTFQFKFSKTTETQLNIDASAIEKARLEICDAGFDLLACRRLLWESLGAKRRVHCACSGTNHWLVGKHIWEVWAFSCPFCVRVSLHSLLDAIGITRLGLTVSGLFLTGVVLKAVPKVVLYRAQCPVFITFLELIGS